VSWSGSATMARPLSKGQIKEAYQGDKGKNMASYQILYWFDIPVQVRASIGRNRRTVPLTNRFVEAVDAAAMAAGLSASDAYTEQFRWSEAEERDGEPDVVAAAVVAELEAQFPEIDWRATAQALRERHN
jgi:hypothetical protein